MYFRSKDLSPRRNLYGKPQSKSPFWRFKENKDRDVREGVFISENAFRWNQKETLTCGFILEDHDFTLE